MEVKVQSIRFVSDHKLNEFIKQRVNKLNLFFDNILDSEVFLKIDSANKIDNKYLVFTESGRNCSNKTVVDWVKQIQSLGAGEIILTSISKEGLGEGFDIELIEQIEKITNVPLVIHGGAGRISDIEKIISKYKISGAAIASAFHYYYLKNFQKAEQSSGNKDFSLGLRGEMEYNSFSLPQVKEITKKY